MLSFRDAHRAYHRDQHGNRAGNRSSLRPPGLPGLRRGAKPGRRGEAPEYRRRETRRRPGRVGARGRWPGAAGGRGHRCAGEQCRDRDGGRGGVCADRESAGDLRDEFLRRRPYDASRSALDGVGRSGTIVNVTSMMGRLTLGCHAFYAATKFALAAVSESLAIEIQPFGVRVAIIEPGVILTPIWNKGEVLMPDWASLRARDGPLVAFVRSPDGRRDDARRGGTRDLGSGPYGRAEAAVRGGGGRRGDGGGAGPPDGRGVGGVAERAGRREVPGTRQGSLRRRSVQPAVAERAEDSVIMRYSPYE
ncbi:hypothetical protein SBA4_1210017 [Candidatus Sulfopaludibacter sp. SbA4]|nr:hypothetical protein SBA4_1210017 [Candidatus Sulfopaludibacter sp. SbA4]